MTYDNRRVSRWYFGGVASSMAAMITHPLDLLKVLIQTQQSQLSITQTTKAIIKEQGFLAMYNGISASLLRQYTYTLTRFGLYTFGASNFDLAPMQNKVLLAASSGAAGGFVGAPADLINVRLQNDVKLPQNERRNYKHAIDGLVRVCREEGFTSLFNGASFAAIRGGCMTVGQIAFYEQSKDMLIQAGFPNKMNTYICASIISAVAAVIITQPIDVIKTRRQNARPNEYKNTMDLLYKTTLEGPMAYFKGSVPALVRLGPHTVLLFVTLELLRTHFGYLPDDK